MKASRAFSVGAAVGALCSAAATWGLPAPHLKEGLASPTRFPPTPLGRVPVAAAALGTGRVEGAEQGRAAHRGLRPT